MTPPLHFTADYREEVVLERPAAAAEQRARETTVERPAGAGEQRARETTPNAATVILRLLRPSDREQLRAGFERMSPESRYRRFFTMKNRLTEAELSYLTEIDGFDHFALAALHLCADGSEEGVGVGRLVRLQGEVAEMAIAVIDEWQGRGLGTLLFHRLVAAARERGIHRIRSEVLATHQPLRRLVTALGLPVDRRAEEGVITADLILPPLPPDHPADAPPRDNAGYRLLSLAAQGLVELRRMMPSWLVGPDLEEAEAATTSDPGDDLDDEP